MLERLLKFRDICETNEELHMSQEAWTEIKSIVQTLTTCRIATKNLQREQLTFGDLYKEWTCCILRTQKFGTTLSEALVRAMKAREKQLFQSEPFLAGMFMDTRFSKVRKNTSADTISDTAVSGNEESDADEMETLLRNAEKKKRRRRNKCTTVIENIINALETHAKHTRLKTKESILEFCENKKLVMPELYELSKIILAAPSTQGITKVRSRSHQIIPLLEKVVGTLFPVRGKEVRESACPPEDWTEELSVTEGEMAAAFARLK
ncbi:PREDICTED: uncharacterized protein LOC108759803, partial [Trachymyrmex cornetzi]|uniref:uncharacterized protein LOC108759803 n=1 Tax=Trachymyrmex cornetzi TaxID=471704 RepID=UPI00084F0687